MTTPPHVHPTRDDPVVAGLSESVGGPVGSHAGRHRWWTPVRVLLALTALCFAIGMAQKSGCFATTWTDEDTRYTQMCYSDLPYLYTARGFAETTWPYTDDPQVRERYPDAMEYPVGISYFTWATAHVTQWLTETDPEERARGPVPSISGDEQIRHEVRIFVVVNALGFAALALLTVWFLAGVHRRRPWDASAFALAPVLAVSALINWDLLSVALVAAALWTWARNRYAVTGLLIGLGVAVKLYPLFLLGGVLVLCARQRRWNELVLTVSTAAAAWTLANLPAVLTGPQAWLHFWSFNSERAADLGSLWLVASQWLDVGFSHSTINAWSWALFALWCAGVAAIGWLAPQGADPRLAQLGFLVVAGFLIVNKVYSPQYVLWLLPLAVLARPRWRDQMTWQAGELVYFAMVWWYLGGFLDVGSDEPTPWYWLAILVRVAAQLYLVALVVRDILRPEHDPVPRGTVVPPVAQSSSTASKDVAV